ncbi:toxin [Gardnerella vaginalis]|uniref:toxin n=1 Tax=Gardnerella vaginalis TaxID=2702 RepID=UPI00051930FD|nr:toxin [Gardnerella vaginalis]
MVKPTISYAVAVQKYKAELNEKIVELNKQIPIPTYMIEGIVASVLSDMRSAVIAENSMEYEAYVKQLEDYFNSRERELNDEILKIKAEKAEKDEKDEKDEAAGKSVKDEMVDEGEKDGKE